MKCKEVNLLLCTARRGVKQYQNKSRFSKENMVGILRKASIEMKDEKFKQSTRLASRSSAVGGMGMAIDELR